MTTSKSTNIVIVGAGFGGIRAARRLSRQAGLHVTLISTNDTFAYYPQIFHTASGGSRAVSTISLGEMLAGTGVNLVKDTITALDPETKTVTGTNGTAYPYDQLILAMGNVTNYFGIPGIEEFSHNIKTIAGAEKFKQQLHQQLTDDGKPDDNYVIVGGGPTGLELAAALATYLPRIAKKHGLANAKFNIAVVEALPQLLPRSPKAVGERVQKRLESLGVKVMTGAMVKSQTADAIQLDSGPLPTKTVVWTAGVANNPFFKTHPELFTAVKGGKIQVDEHLQARPDIYVIGDNAATQYSGLAEVAIADANFVTADILRANRGATRPAYHQHAPISVIPVGHQWAVAQWGNLTLYGFLGFILRRLGDLVGYYDVQPIPQALRVWMDESRREDNCDTCQPEQATSPAQAS